MAGRLAFDTTFLIDLQRERMGGDSRGPAHRFLADTPDQELYLSVTALGEFAEGFEQAGDPLLRAIRELHVLLPIDEKTALIYGQLARGLRGAGRLIGANDLWIASASLQHDLPLVTSNATEFGRVKGLEVVRYD